MSKVAILLVLYNDSKHIISLINSIKNQTFNDYEIYALETKENEESLKLLERLYPKTKSYKYRGNLGYAAGNNFLAEEAIKQDCQYLAIFNTDIILEKNALTILMESFSNNKSAAFSIPITYIGTPENEKGIQNYILNSNYDKCQVVREKTNIDFLELPKYEKLNTPSGCCFIIKSDIVKKAGLFNEENFMYCDEIDLSYRLTKNNYYGVISKYAKVWHNHNWEKSNNRGNNLEYFYIMRNSMLFFHRYNKTISLLKFFFTQLVRFPLVLYWTISKKGIKFVYYYYLGLICGLLNIKGKSSIKF